MTHEELDRLWFQAMEESIKDGEMVARYHFAAAIIEKCAQVCEDMRPSKPEFDHRYYDACTDCAEAIKSRINT